MAGPEPGMAAWPERYKALLATAGLDPEGVLGEALQPGASEQPALFSLQQCLDEPDMLIRQLQKDYPDARGTRSVRAHLSVLQQDLALSVIAPLTLRLFLHGQAPLPDARQIFLGRAVNGSSTGRWFQASTQTPVAVDGFVEQLGQQVNAWYPTFRQDLGISPGAYWSSVGLALGAPFSAVWNRVEATSVCRLGREWLAEFVCDANRFIDWIPAEFNGQTCALPQRKGCCLKYLLPEGGYCGTCGIYRKERLAAFSRTSRRQAVGQWPPEQ